MRELSRRDAGPARPPWPVSVSHKVAPASLGAVLRLVLTVPLCSRPVPSSSQMVVLCSPIWHLCVDLAAQAPGGTRHRLCPSSRHSWMRPSSGVGCGVSAPLGLLAKGLNLAAESIEGEFVFRFYSVRWCRLISPEMGILGSVPGVFLQMPLSTLVQPPLDTDGRSWPPVGRELCRVGVGRGLAFGPGRALWETLISLTLTRAHHRITSKSQDKPSGQPECLLLGRDNGRLAPPDSHLRGSTQAAPSPPVLLRSLPATGALSNFPHHPGASQDQRISSGPQQGTSPAGSGFWGWGEDREAGEREPCREEGSKGEAGGAPLTPMRVLVRP